jgi:hypothetical protein
MQFSPSSFHFISLWSKYSPQHPVVKHPQSVFLPSDPIALTNLRIIKNRVIMRNEYGSTVSFRNYVGLYII